MTISTPSIDGRSVRPGSRGAVLVIVLLIAALLALGVGSYLALNLSAARLARHSYQQNAAFQLAEAGSEEALWSFNQAHGGSASAWADWTIQSPAAWRKFSGFDLGGDTRGSVKVYVDNTQPGGPDRPSAVALATVTSPSLPPTTRMIQVTLARRSYFGTGIVAKDSLNFAGANVTVDSWNSDPANNPATPPVPYSAAVRNDQGSIATAATLPGTMLVNNGHVWGSAATGGAAPTVGTMGSIRGKNTPAGVQIDPARVTTNFTANLPVIGAPLDGTPLLTLGTTLGTAGQATKWRCPSISLQGSSTLTILGDVTLILTAATGDALSLTGNAALIIPTGSSLTLYVEGNCKIAGNGLANANVYPGSCKIYGTNATPLGQSIEVAGNGALLAALYAPNAEIKVVGNGDVMGGIVGETVTFTGNASFHYDEALTQSDPNAPFGVVSWRELTDPAARNAWQAVFANW